MAIALTSSWLAQLESELADYRRVHEAIDAVLRTA